MEDGGAGHVCGENEKVWKLEDKRKLIVFVAGGLIDILHPSVQVVVAVTAAKFHLAVITDIHGVSGQVGKRNH
jgi:hypothetical protein